MKFYLKYKHLIYSLATLLFGISIIIKQESKYLLGLIILSISFGYLLTFVALQIKNRKLKKSLNYLSYIIPICFVIYSAVKWLI